MKKSIKYSHAYQPIFNIKTKKIISYEVLLRGLNNQSPAIVLNQLSNQNLYQFDQLSREKAIIFVANQDKNLNLNFNFSPGSILIENGKYVIDTIQFAQKLGITAKQLTLEITENETFASSKDLIQILNELRRTGITIAIDDFGSGYAGLNVLAEIQPDLLKLDIKLIKNIHKDGPRQSIVRAISSVCYDLGIDIVAEGVESLEEFRFLKNLGIYLYQGFYFAKPGFEKLPKVRKNLFSESK